MVRIRVRRADLNPIKLIIKFVCRWVDWIKLQNPDYHDQGDAAAVVIIGLVLGALGFAGLLHEKLTLEGTDLSWFKVFAGPLAFWIFWYSMIVIVVYAIKLIRGRKEWMDD